MEEEEEDDYMSDSVLKSCGDVRPGLYKSTKESHKRLQEKKSAESRRDNLKPIKVRESENRDEALNKSLDSTNKGFALLQRMGYKPGSAIGKSGEGRIEPIGIKVKSDRGGLGQEAEKRRRDDERKKAFDLLHEKRRKLAQAAQQSFRTTKMMEQRNKRIEKFVRDSQKVCEQLDSAQGVNIPLKPFYWPPQLLAASSEDQDGTDDENEDEEDEVPLPLPEQLEELTQYLRSTHFYCIWCGFSFGDAESLSNKCPGGSAEDHDEL